MKTFEDEIAPKRNKLIEDKEGNITAEIIDVELDVLKLEFEGDDCVNIDSIDYTYIKLSLDDLEQLKDLLIKQIMST